MWPCSREETFSEPYSSQGVHKDGEGRKPMKTWWLQFKFKALYLLAQLVGIRPFIKVDPNEYCPACGHRKGRVVAVANATDVAVRHLCDVCQWQWDTPTVSVILPTQIIAPVQDTEEDEPESFRKPGQFERFVQVKHRSEMKVNGLSLKD